MGLDMYLEAERYVSGWDHGKDPEYESLLNETGLSALATKDSPWISVTIPAAYWRKVNWIHGWFVREVQDGVDDCRDYDVSEKQLVELRGICQGLLDLHEEDPDAAEDQAMEDLPPQSGFFFGSDTIKDWYWDSLKDTVNQIDRCLTNQPEGVYFRYRASW